MASWTVAPSAACLLTQADAIAPGRSTASDGTIGDASHASRQSDHNPDSRGVVHAADVTHDPAHGFDTRAYAEIIRLRAKAGKEPRLKYIISFSKIASANTDWEWVDYDGVDPHENHMHVSVNSGATESNTTPWYTVEGLTDMDISNIIDAVHEEGKKDRAVTVRQGRKTRKMVRQVGHVLAGKDEQILHEIDRVADSIEHTDPDE